MSRANQGFKDITKKPGYQPYQKDFKWKKDLVTIRIPDIPNDGEAHVVLAGIDGVHYNIPRGQDVKVPRLIAEMLKTKYQHHWAIGGKNPMQGMRYLGKQPRFYVLELGEKEAPEVKQALPMGVDQRQEMLTAQIQAAADEAHAREELVRVRNTPHESLKE